MIKLKFFYKFIFIYFLIATGAYSADFDKGFNAFVIGDYNTALNEFRELADAGDVNAQFMLGSMYFKGYGVELNYQEAVRWYTLAAEQNESGAQYNLGLSYLDGSGVEKNIEEGIRWLELAAEQDHVEAIHQLGLVYYYLLADYDSASKWFSLGMDFDYAESIIELALMFEHGDGITQSYTDAFDLYLIAAELGNSKAQCQVGYHLRNGVGVDKNIKEALRWYLESANQLNTKAFYNIGVMYANGEFFDRNYVIGYIWLYLASLHESDESETARNTIKKLENYMSEDEISDALDLSNAEGIEYYLIESASERLEIN